MTNYELTLFIQLFGSFIVTVRINKSDINDLLVFNLGLTGVAEPCSVLFMRPLCIRVFLLLAWSVEDDLYSAG